MTQQATSNFILVNGGAALSVPNGVQNSSSNLAVTYSPEDSETGEPDTTTEYSVAIVGIASGTQTLLDSFASTTGVVTRSVSLAALYDSFLFVPTFTNTNFEIAVEVVNKGAGAAFAANLDLPSVHTQ